MRTEIKLTGDGSTTLYVPHLDEHYHSINGAVRESLHVFIRAGLRQLNLKCPAVFELGFGTGLNALLTLLEKEHFDRIDYHGIELFPVEWRKINSLSYPSFLNLDADHKDIFEKMHKLSWGILTELTPNFYFEKIKGSFIDFKMNNKYDLVYFDAFAPLVQPELWEEPVFQKIYNSMNPGGILVTYCAKGEVRRIMKRCGFKVERLAGPPGKREMLRSTRIAD